MTAGGGGEGQAAPGRGANTCQGPESHHWQPRGSRVAFPAPHAAPRPLISQDPLLQPLLGIDGLQRRSRCWGGRGLRPICRAQAPPRLPSPVLSRPLSFPPGHLLSPGATLRRR